MPESLERAQSSASESTSVRYFASPLKFSHDWITRPLFAVLLAGVAVGATILGGFAFVVFLVAGTAPAAREWHRLFAKRELWQPTLVTVFAIVGSLVSQLLWQNPHGIAALSPFFLLWAGAIAQLPLAFWRQESPIAHAGGVLYFGIPALSLLLLRLHPVHPLWLVLLLFAAIWSTDTGALFIGRLVGGPKLAPRLSPGKTWAGFFGGIASAGLFGAAVAEMAGAKLLPASLFSVAIALAAQMGDLFESWVKRLVGVKDSGGLIPGHGGMLDRIDSSLCAVPLAALLVLGFGLDPLQGIGR